MVVLGNPSNYEPLHTAVSQITCRQNPKPTGPRGSSALLCSLQQGHALRLSEDSERVGKGGGARYTARGKRLKTQVKIKRGATYAGSAGARHFSGSLLVGLNRLDRLWTKLPQLGLEEWDARPWRWFDVCGAEVARLPPRLHHFQ